MERSEAKSGGARSAPLDGITVLDFSQFLAGPSCALRLADLGARVIKVERPDGGDACRSLQLADVSFDQDSALFHAINRGKESYTADLKDSADLAAVKKLIARADVMIHNFRPGIMDRLGLGWKEIEALNSRVVYAGVSGYGLKGPWRDRPGQDLLVQALSGIARLSGDAGSAPVPAGLAIVDMMAGAQLCQGILALLLRRGIDGRGGRVDVSLLEAAVDLQFEHLSVFLNAGDAMPERSEIANGNVYLPAPYGIYPTLDGHLALAMAPLDRLFGALGLSGPVGIDPMEEFARRDEIKAILRDHIARGTNERWLSALDAAGLWAAPVLDWSALVKEPAFEAIDAVQEVRSVDGDGIKLTRCPIRIDGEVIKSTRAAPRLGANRAQIDWEFAI